MFDTDALVTECLAAVQEPDPRRAVRELLLRTLEKTSPVQDRLGKDVGGLETIYNSPDLTVMNVIWAPGMKLYPHDHQMWAVIGIYGGIENNTLYRRGPETITASGGRELRESEVLSLGADAIHAVANPERRFTGAIHIYGGDFINQPRSQWDPDTLIEQPYDLVHIRKLFAEANAAWAAQVGHDVDEETS
jgi:predicted metal-dependent enzyme (double-stranded beta helix superfamily)